jgi:hypothetical protein
MVNYKNGKIYCIRSFQTEKVYVGSTCEKLSKRMAHHRNAYKRYLNGKCNKVTSYDILKYDDAYIELIEYCPCDSREELCKKEGEHIRKNECVNKRCEGVIVDAKYKSEYNKKYRKNNMKYYSDYNNKWGSIKIKCEVCNIEIRKDSMNKHIKRKKHLKNLK